MDIDKHLFNEIKMEYGGNYFSHYMDQYKLYLEIADSLISRRQSANSFFLTVNMVIISVISYIQPGKESTDSSFYWLVSVSGIILCIAWHGSILSYKRLSVSKFEIIHAIERNLPMSLHSTEWKLLGEGNQPSLYIPFTSIERTVPWVFLFLHLIVLMKSAMF